MDNPMTCCTGCGAPAALGLVRVLSITGSADCCALCAMQILGRVDAGMTDVTIMIGAGAAVAG